MSRTRKDGQPLIDFAQGYRIRWPENTGRYLKRRLSKARRRAWRDEHERGLLGAERECNYKGW